MNRGVGLSLVGCVVIIGSFVGGLLLFPHSTGEAKFAREEISRASQFHAYNGAIKADQGRLRDFIAEWTKVCSQKGLALQMDPTGDPGCAKPAPTPAPSAPPAAPAPAAPSAVK